MTRAAEGHVWQFFVTPNAFEKLKEDLLVVHHMRDGDKIRVRCVASEKPAPNAETVTPLLEDAYLWLLKSERKR